MDIATDNVYSEETDFASIALGIHSRLNLTFQRTYNSRIDYCGPPRLRLDTQFRHVDNFR
ncbi:hypothetical protein [Desulforhabdus amnigena]|uniref:hypothetical protein n=1 Tax=Desulforhabdus amnigena TaxID=40218 RepID=UPI0035A22C58